MVVNGGVGKGGKCNYKGGVGRIDEILKEGRRGDVDVVRKSWGKVVGDVKEEKKV